MFPINFLRCESVGNLAFIAVCARGKVIGLSCYISKGHQIIKLGLQASIAAMLQSMQGLCSREL